jgi:hypothetical protein
MAPKRLDIRTNLTLVCGGCGEGKPAQDFVLKQRNQIVLARRRCKACKAEAAGLSLYLSLSLSSENTLFSLSRLKRLDSLFPSSDKTMHGIFCAMEM